MTVSEKVSVIKRAFMLMENAFSVGAIPLSIKPLAPTALPSASVCAAFAAISITSPDVMSTYELPGPVNRFVLVRMAL